MAEGVRVIIADDHEPVRSGVAAILSTDPGIEVVGHAADGFEALTLCVEHSPDVALVDLRMPGKDGIWATERITAGTPTRVLVLTTFDSDDLISSALAAGAHGFLLKTTSGAELVLAVRHVAANRHVLDPAITAGVIDRYTRATSTAASTSAEPPPPLPELTERERQVWERLVLGESNKQIASALGIGITTVKTHVGSLYAKTGATSRVELAQRRLTQET